MESLIKSQNFVHNNQNVFSTYQSSVERLTTDKKDVMRRGSNDVLKSLKVFGDKLTCDRKPKPDTAGWDMAEFTFTKLVEIASQLVLKKSPSKDISEGFYAFLIRLLDNSLVKLHLKLTLRCLDQSEIQLKEHIQTLNTEELNAVLSVLCRPVKPDEVSGQDNGDLYCQLMKKILTETISPEQVILVSNQLLDYAVYCYLACTELPEKVYDKVAETGERVLKKLVNPLSSCNDEKLKLYIRKCTEIIQSKNLPQSEKNVEHIIQFMNNFMHGLRQQDKFEVLYIEIFDLLMAISKCQITLGGDKYCLKLFSAAANFFSCSSFSPVKDDSVFKSIVEKFIQVVKEMDIKFLDHDEFANLVVENALKNMYSNDKQKTSLWLGMIVPLLKRPCESMMKACATITSEKKCIKWKEHPDIVKKILDTLESFQSPPSEMCHSLEEVKKYVCHLEETAKNIFKGLKKERLTKYYGKEMMSIALTFLITDYEELFKIAEAVAEEIELNPLKDKNVMITAMRRFCELLGKYSVLDGRAAGKFFDKVTEPFKDGKVFTDDEFSLFMSICLKCLQQKPTCSVKGFGNFPSDHLLFFFSVFSTLTKWLERSNKLEMASPLVPDILKYLADGEESVLFIIESFLQLLVHLPSGSKTLSPYLDDMIECFLQCENKSLLDIIITVYPKNPKALTAHFRDLIQLMGDHGDPYMISSLARLFQNVSVKQAELFTSHDIEMLFSKALEDAISQSFILQVLQEITKRCPEKIVQHVELLYNKSLWNPQMFFFLNDMLITLSYLKEEIASTFLEECMKNLNPNGDKIYVINHFSAVRMIGIKYPHLLKPKRKEIVEIKTMDPDLIFHVKCLLDMIDGNTPEEMVKELKLQGEKVTCLFGRADETEEVLFEVKEEVIKQGEELDEVKSDVLEQGHKLTSVDMKAGAAAMLMEQMKLGQAGIHLPADLFKPLNIQQSWQQDRSHQPLNVQQSWQQDRSRQDPFANLQQLLLQADQSSAINFTGGSGSFGQATQLPNYSSLDFSKVDELFKKAAEKAEEEALRDISGKFQ